MTLDKHWPGIIAGGLFRPDGTRATAGIDLNLLRLEDGEYRLAIADEVLTDEHGEYAFRSVRPGKYKIVLHWCCYPTPVAPYPVIYWPGGASEEAGSDIFVGMAPDAMRYDFRLPAEVKSRTVAGQVLLADGKPAPGSEVWLLNTGDEKHGCCDVADQVRADSEGHFAIKIMDGLSYGLCIRQHCFGLNSVMLVVSFNEAPNPIKLRMESTTTAKN